MSDEPTTLRATITIEVSGPEDLARLLEDWMRGEMDRLVTFPSGGTANDVRQRIACGISAPQHLGEVRLRQFMRHGGWIAKIWACGSCWDEVEAAGPRKKA